MYGGTASEMARLVNEMKVLGLDEAGELITVDAQTVKNVGLDKIIEAIHLVQQELGITGTTAKEAEGTITGSMGQARAAFENLLVGFGDSKQDVRALTDTLAKTIETMVKNAIPRIKQIVKGMWTSIKTALRTYMPELANSIIPTVEKIGKAIKDLFGFIAKNGNTIIAIVKGLVAAFLTFKVASLIQSATTALAGLLNLTNPVGLLITAIAGLVGVFVALKESANKMSEEEAARKAMIDETTESLNDNVEAWKNLKETQEEYVSTESGKLNYYESLWKELQKITDENGKITEGYEARAKFITTTLSDAYGIEIDVVDGVIQKYDELKSTMNDVTAQKRAQVILAAQEQMYTDALENRDARRSALEAARDALGADTEEALENWQKLNKLMDQASQGAVSDELYNQIQEAAKALGYTANQSENLVSFYGRVKDELGLVKAYNEAREALDESYYYIGLYENNYAKMQEGLYDEMVTTRWKYNESMASSEEARIAEMRKNYESAKTEYKHLAELIKTTGDVAYEAGLKMTENEAEQYAERLRELGVFVDGTEQLYNRLAGVYVGASAISAKGAAIQGILNRNEELTSQSIAQAISGMEIVLDDEQVGRFVTKTVTRQVYATAR